MAITVPFLPSIEKLSEILDLVHSDSEMGKRLAVLDEYEKRINSALARYKDIMDAQAYLSTAHATLEGANKRLQDADAYWESKKKEHDSVVADLTKRQDDFNAQARDYQKDNANRQRDLNTRETAIIAQEQRIAKLDADAKALKASAEAQMAAAQSMKNEYDEKMKRMRELAA